jgi:hypothetical protein
MLVQRRPPPVGERQCLLPPEGTDARPVGRQVFLEKGPDRLAERLRLG